MTPEEAFSQIRAELVGDANNAYRGDADYAVRDPALIDGVIQAVIKRSFRGQVPTDASGVARVARRCRGAYTSLIDEQPARAEVEAHLARRYANPRLSWDRGMLVADHGLAPGPLVRAARAGWSVQASPVVDQGEWRTEEAAGALQRLWRAHPEAGALSARIDIPTGSLVTKFEYRWIPSQDRVVVTRATASTFAWVQPQVGGDLGPWVRGERTLQTSALSRTSLTRKIWGWDPDAPV